MIANSILKHLIILEYHMGVYHANDRTSIFDVSHDYVKKVELERKPCFSRKCHISGIDIQQGQSIDLFRKTLYSRTLVRISFHQ